MDLNEAKILAEKEMAKHLGSEWTFSYNRRKKAFGVCKYYKEEIQLSKILTSAGEESRILNTIRHEIAHALAYTKHNVRGHGKIWKSIFLGLGGDGSRTNYFSEREIVENEPIWVMVFGTSIVKTYHRKPNRKTFATINVAYMACYPKFVTQGKLKLIQYSDYKMSYAA